MKSEFYRTIPALAAYIDRIGAEELNFRRYVVKEHRGAYYTERAIIRLVLGDNGYEIKCTSKDYAPTKSEADAIRGALMAVQFPKAIPFKNMDALRKRLGKDAELYELIDRRTGEIVMVQQRIEKKDGGKAYPSWTFWSDGEFRAMEPEGDLPFWKPREKRPVARIMIHEGPKAAKFIDELVNNPANRKALEAHPWAEDLKRYEHWGQIGGAMVPHRADFAEVRREKPMEVVYVCDNDWPGQAALQEVSRHYGAALRGIRFDKRWPMSWDMADPMPKTFFNGTRYKGPTLADLMVCATRATELVPNPEGKGRPVPRLKRDFREEWFHCVTPEVFVHIDLPDKILTTAEFNNFVSPFSDVADTAQLLKKDATSKSAVLEYNPGMPSGIYGAEDIGRYINTHVPAAIKAEEGDVTPFEEFMQNLVTDDQDRHELKRWVATLIARPEIKMNYGVLLISEIQGVGKSTLGEKILAPLVGRVNTSYPSENEIVESNFNYWLAHKRLAVVHEIYAGHSSRAYNKLKSVITDRYITVSKKFQANYLVENWCHVYACSNSMRAIHLPNDDRRWFVPKITETKQSKQYWSDLNYWLTDEGGLNKIKWWAQEFCEKNEPVQRGESSPDSALKREIIEDGYSPGQALVARTLDQIRETLNEGDETVMNEWRQRGWINGSGGVFLLDAAIVQMIKDQLYEGRQNDRLERPGTIRRLAKAKGWFVGEHRAQVKDWGYLGARPIFSEQAMAKKRPFELCNEKMEPEEKLRPIDLAQIVKL